jgi:hypothetical protein
MKDLSQMNDFVNIVTFIHMGRAGSPITSIRSNLFQTASASLHIHWVSFQTSL